MSTPNNSTSDSQFPPQWQFPLFQSYSSLVADSLPFLVASVDTEQRYSWTNEAYERWFGIAPGLIIGKYVWEVIGASAYEVIKPHLDEALRGKQVAFEADLIYKTAGAHTVYVEYIPYNNADKQVAGIFLVVTDITAYTKAIGTIERNRQELADFVENGPVGMHWVGADGIILWANKAEMEMLGYSREEYIGRNIADFHADFPVIENILQRLSDGEEIRNYEARLRCKNGSIKYVLISSNVLFKKNDFIHTRCFTRDITQLHFLQEKLKLGEERFRMALSASPITVFSQDADLHYTWAYPSVPGSTPDAPSGDTHTKLIGPMPDAENIQGIKHHALKSAQGSRQEVWARTGGTSRCYDLTIDPIKDADGRVTGLNGVALDITERKLSESQWAHLAAIVSASDDAIIGKTPDGIIQSWNPGAEQVYGYRAEEAIGQSIAIIIPRDYADEAAAIQARVRTGEALRQLETIRVRKDKRRIHVSLTMSPIKDEDGKVIAIATIERDITTKRSAEKALTLAAKQKDEFIAMLGHELRNPLAPLRSALDMLQRSDFSSERQTMFARMGRQVDRMTRLVDDLLDVSRVARGVLQMRKEKLDIVRLVQSAVEDYRESFADAKLQPYLDLPTRPVWVNGDATRLFQVLANLLRNAEMYNEAGGEIHIGVAIDQAAHTVEISVRDTGIGMAPDLISMAFEPFIRGESAYTPRGGGLGLGLALVKGVVELHGGFVHLFSEGEGHGSTFTARLPLLENQTDIPHKTNNKVDRLPSFKMLLIEDNVDASESMQQLLLFMGQQVEVAHDGVSGVEHALRFHPEIVLCDINMPGKMNGFAVATALRSNEALRGILLYALTGYGRPEDHRRAREAGFDALFSKPLGADGLEQILTEAARIRNLNATDVEPANIP